MGVTQQKKYINFHRRLVILGFGCIGQATLPLILRHIDLNPEKITIITKTVDGQDEAEKYGVNFITSYINQENYVRILRRYVAEGDFLLNLSVDISSFDLIKFCHAQNALYLDTCIEPWAGGYTNKNIPSALRSNYALREEVVALKAPSDGTHHPTAMVTHGANPGLVSYFLKQALLNMAKDNGLALTIPKQQSAWAQLAQRLNIKAIHIAERDTQITNCAKRPGEFVNTWSVDGFISEGLQPAELGWGTHERQLPKDGLQHEFGSRCAIYLNRPGAATRVRTWTPLSGAFHGFLITHGESIGIADYFTLKDEDKVCYRPTVHYAYHPCEDAVLSLHEWRGREWCPPKTQRLLDKEIIDGTDELGVLLMGNEKGAYWFGSQLTIQEARRLAPFNNATSLQVAAGVLAGMIFAIDNPNRGIQEPDDIDFQFMMEIALPYLGKMTGRYTDWTPLQSRTELFPEPLDHTDPWQFTNIRVT